MPSVSYFVFPSYVKRINSPSLNWCNFISFITMFPVSIFCWLPHIYLNFLFCSFISCLFCKLSEVLSMLFWHQCWLLITRFVFDKGSVIIFLYALHFIVCLHLIHFLFNILINGWKKGWHITMYLAFHFWSSSVMSDSDDIHKIYCCIIMIRQSHGLIYFILCM